MLYRFFKFLFTLTTKAYFRSIYISGKENIPAKGPVIFAANHSSAFMDPILLGVQIHRNLYFLARGDVFKNKFIALFFKAINMIPVYKPDLNPDEMHKNEFTFKKCFDHLQKGKTIVIFPEGISKTERRLRPIKTGVSRIGLGAETAFNTNLNTQIIPIGINYSNPHFFRSDVLVNYGKPIEVLEYKEAYLKDPKEAVLALTERVKTELEKLVVVIADERLDKIIQQIEILYRSKLRDESKPNDKAPQDFYLSKDIVKAVEYFAKTKPEQLEEFEIKLDSYLHSLKRLKIRDSQIRTSKVYGNVKWSILFIGLGFPLFLYGVIFNFLPFKIAEAIAKNKSIREDFVGSIKMAAGMFIFLILYFLQAVAIGYAFNFWWSLAFVLLGYPTGLFTIQYIKKYFLLRGTFKYLHLFLRKSDLITSIKTTRNELVNTLEESKVEYLKEKNR